MADLSQLASILDLANVGCAYGSVDGTGGLQLGLTAACNGPVNAYVAVFRTATATPTYAQEFKIVDAADTARTASTEHATGNFNANAGPTWATGALALQRNWRFQAGTISFAGASTVTQATCVSIDSQPGVGANCTITDSYGLLTGAGVRSGFGGQLVGNLAPLAMGFATVNLASDANLTLTASQAASPILNVTSTTLTATRNVILPANPMAGALMWVINGTTGAQAIQVIGQSGTGVTIATGKRALLSFDGTNVIRLTADQ